jgi:ribose 5-phosphate isomerase B
MATRTLYIGADHAGYALKEELKKRLSRNNKVVDCGNTTYDKNDDYPTFAEKVAREAVAHKAIGVLICGTAEGVCIAANKVRGARAIAATTPIIAKLARQHNNANILCLAGGQMLSPVPELGLNIAEASKIIHTFINTPFSSEARHKRRVKMITRIEQRR